MSTWTNLITKEQCNALNLAFDEKVNRAAGKGAEVRRRKGIDIGFTTVERRSAEAKLDFAMRVSDWREEAAKRIAAVEIADAADWLAAARKRSAEVEAELRSSATRY